VTFGRGTTIELGIGRLRAIATAIVIVASLLAVVATSPPEAAVFDETHGRPFLLSPEHPDVRARFVVEASRAVFDDPGTIGLHLETVPHWSGLGSVPPAIPVEVDKIAGPPSRMQDGDGALVCGGDPACVGTYGVTFRWPSGLDRGTVRVEWGVSFSVSYDRAEAPPGAVVSVGLERGPDGHAPRRFFEDGYLPLGADAPIAVRRVWILSTAPMARSTELAFELDGPAPEDDGTRTVVTLSERGRTADPIAPSTSTPIEVPGRCRSGPCGFWFSLAFVLHAADNRDATVQSWGLTASAPVPHVAVRVERTSPPAVTGGTRLGGLRMRGDRTSDPYVVTVEITPEALPSAEVGDLAPVIRGRVFLRADPVTLVFPEHGRVETEVLFTWRPQPSPGSSPGVASFSSPRYGHNIAAGEYPITFVVPNSCRAGLPCELAMTVRFTTEMFEGGRIDLEPVVEVELGYPILGAVPAGASLDVAVEPIP
jgi:hypothetical protein